MSFELAAALVAVFLVGGILMVALFTRVGNLERELASERKYRNEASNDIQDRYWKLRRQLDATFSAMGMEMQAGRPATDGRWAKREEFDR